MSQLYQGLTKKSKIWIIGSATAIAVINLLFSWFLAYQIIDNMRFTQSDIKNIKSLSDLSDNNSSTVYDRELRTLSMNANIHLKGITNKQTIVVLSITSGFTFVAIGFALFLIGVDGAMHISHEHQDSKLFISVTAPGLVSFLLAALLILYGVSRTYELDLPGIEGEENITKRTNDNYVIAKNLNNTSKRRNKYSSSHVKSNKKDYKDSQPGDGNVPEF